MTGWTGSSRRTKLPPDWHRTQPRILARDGYQCQHIRQDTGRACLASARDVDHIVPDTRGGGDEDGNLQSLCTYHHGQKSGREGGVASGAARRAKARASAPTHPGLLATPVKPPTASNRPAVDDSPAPF